jgi:hypothetical protein
MGFLEMFVKKKKKNISFKEYSEMKRFLLAQISDRDKRIEKLKEERQIILNMAIKKSNDNINSTEHKKIKHQ